MIKIRSGVIANVKKRNYSPQRRYTSNWHIRPTLCYLGILCSSMAVQNNFKLFFFQTQRIWPCPIEIAYGLCTRCQTQRTINHSIIQICYYLFIYFVLFV